MINAKDMQYLLLNQHVLEKQAIFLISYEFWGYFISNLCKGSIVVVFLLFVIQM